MIKVRAGRGAAPGEKVRGGGDDLEDDFEEELGEAVKPALKRKNESDGDGDGDGGSDSDDPPTAADLEWEKGEDGAVLKERAPRGDKSDRKKKRKSGDGNKKATKAKKSKVVEF